MADTKERRRGRRKTTSAGAVEPLNSGLDEGDGGDGRTRDGRGKGKTNGMQDVGAKRSVGQCPA